MSHSIVKKIAIKADGVYFASASSNVYPRSYDELKSEYYSKLYAEKGLDGLVKDLAGELQNGNIRVLRGTRFCNFLFQAQEEINSYRNENLCGFLSRELYSDYILKSFIAKMSRDPGFSVTAELEKLCALKKDPEVVFAMCKENPEAFFYADPSIQANRELCKRYVREFAGELMFHYPEAILDDLESVKLAASKYGCVFRRLPESLRDDPEVVLTAFGAEKYPEHLPDLISTRLQNDVELMKKVIEVEPRLHFTRSEILMTNPEIVPVLAEKAAWVSDFARFPEALRNTPEVQKIMAARLHDAELTPEQKAKRLEVLSRFVLPQYLVPEQLKDAVALEYKGIVFDEWTVDEETGGIWGEMCECCADKYKDVFVNELSDGGVGACSVYGCDVVGADHMEERNYYVDFRPELIKPLNEKQLEELHPECVSLAEKIAAARGQMEVTNFSEAPAQSDRSLR